MLQVSQLQANMLSPHPLSEYDKDPADEWKNREAEQSKLAADLPQCQSLAGVMEELGPICTKDADNFMLVCSQFPKFNDHSVGRAIGMMALAQSHQSPNAKDEVPQDPQDFATLCVAIDNTAEHALAEKAQGVRERAPVAEPGLAWNTTHFVAVLQAVAPKISWQNALRALDFKGFRFPGKQANTQGPAPEMRGFSVLTNCYRQATRQEVIFVQHFLEGGLWRHTEAQLALLALCVQSPPTVTNFKTKRMVPEAQKGGHNGVEVQPDDIWCSIDTVEALLSLSTYSEPMCQKALSLFDHSADKQRNHPTPGPVSKCPDLLLLALCHSRPINPLGLRRELAKRVLAVLLFRKERAVVNLLARVAKELGPDLLMTAAADVYADGGLPVVQALSSIAHEGLWFNELMRKCQSPTLMATLVLVAARNQVPQGEPGSAEWCRLLFAQEANVPIACNLPAFAVALFQAVSENTGASQGLHPGTLQAYARAISQGRPPVVNSALRNLAQQFAAGASPVVAANGKPPMEPAAPVPQQMHPQAPPQMQQADPPEPSQFTQAIEQEANGYFAQIYNEKLNVDQLIRNLSEWKNSQDERQRLVHFCMIHNLFDEFRFFQKYPAKELRVTADLFGGIVANSILSNNRLAVALKFVLQNLAKPNHQNLRDFSVWALQKFKHRLPEWPQYCQLLKKISNLEQLIPDISHYLEAPAPVGPPPGDAAPSAVGQPGGPTMHVQHDLTTLVQHSRPAIIQPDPGVAEKISYLLTNLDPQKLDEQVQTLSSFLQIDHFPYFAEFLVVKRASLEPLHHKLYIRMLEQLKSKQLDSAVLHATYSSIKALLHSDKIRTNSSERSLLKNLGSWLGLQTIARNKPLMARDLDMKGLILEAMELGRLIAVAPFAAKVLEHAGSSKVFHPPNPWLMGILGLLVDLYQLPDLKLTLRFEVEVLCKNLNLSINDLMDTKGSRTAQRERLEAIRQNLDLMHSTDFHAKTDFGQGPPKGVGQAAQAQAETIAKTCMGPEQGGQPERGDWAQGPQVAHQAQMQSSKAEEARWAAGMKQQPTPTQGTPGTPLLPGQQQGWRDLKDVEPKAPEWQQAKADRTPYGVERAEPRKPHETYRVQDLPDMVRINVPQLSNVQPRLKVMVAHAIDKALGELIGAVVERSAMIACTATRELVVKDFASEPDEGKLRRAAQMMVRSLASQLAMVTCKDVLRITMRNHLKAVLASTSGPGDPPQPVADAIEQLTKDNLGVGVSIVEKVATDEAARQMSAALAPHLEERARLREQGAWRGDMPLELLPADQRHNWPFLKALPELLRPRSGLLYTQKGVYDDFARLGTGQPPLPAAAPAAGAAPAQLGTPNTPATPPVPTAPAVAIPAASTALPTAAVVPQLQPLVQQPPPPADLSTQRPEVQELLRILQEVEEQTQLHYQTVPQKPDARQVLSLTHSSFTAESQSKHHDQIKALLCRIPQLIKEDSLEVVARLVFDRVLYYSDQITQHQKSNLLQPRYAAMLVNEVCLFTLQSAREKDPKRVVDLLTRLFCEHDRKWTNKDVAVNFIRLRLIDVNDFDLALTTALGAENGGVQPPRLIVEFAGSIVQKCLVDEKLTLQKDLRRTLDALERIAKMARGNGQRQPQGPQQGQPPQRQAEGAVQPAPVARADGAQDVPRASPVAPVPPDASRAQQPQRTAVSVQQQQQRAVPALPVVGQAAGGDGAKAEDEVPSLQEPTVRIPSIVTCGPGGDDLRGRVFGLFREWVGIYQRKMQGASADTTQPGPGQQPATPQQQAMHFVGKLQSAGLLKADFMLDKFFSLLVEISVEDYSSEAARQQQGPNRDAIALYLCVDAFSDLIVLLIKCCAWGNHISGADAKEKGKDGEVRGAVAEVALVSKVISVLSKVLVNNHEYHFTPSAHTTWVASLPQGQRPQSAFMQQPYFRFLSNLLVSLSFGDGPQSGDSDWRPERGSGEMLFLFATSLLSLAPQRLPGFAFAWLELATHRMFMPKLLLTARKQEGWGLFHRLLVAMLQFLEPSLAAGEGLSEPVKLLYKGTLKVMLVLLHDFPEFLTAFHSSLTDVIPPTCVQMRNVVLSSFPRDMKLPDPFTPNLKVDRLPEIAQCPTILSDYTRVLTQPKPGVPPLVSRDELAEYMRRRGPQSFPRDLVARLRGQGQQLIGVMNSLVLFTGVATIEQLQETGPDGSMRSTWLQEATAMDLYTHLSQGLDPEARYHFFNAVANQLRFPNSHTHFFSCVLLHLFMQELPNQEQVQEQITRVLLERLIVNRPHPWGLLITFIELVKNPRYSFWKKGFIRIAPEIARLFDSVGQSCVQPGGGGQGLGQPALQK
eukprot:TRINITY_DN1200_c0_g3_i2.p1 TRINITY_DN1200_c0_g3~~TRINITY_DN1200_c0_g3_i2.p1  ORF type:complete len:2607 (+),score=1039.35 TRINITY_DN1200_c0_g3_i2:857-7822(+)